MRPAAAKQKAVAGIPQVEHPFMVSDEVLGPDVDLCSHLILHSSGCAGGGDTDLAGGVAEGSPECTTFWKPALFQ